MIWKKIFIYNQQKKTEEDKIWDKTVGSNCDKHCVRASVSFACRDREGHVALSAYSIGFNLLALEFYI